MKKDGPWRNWGEVRWEKEGRRRNMVHTSVHRCDASDASDASITAQFPCEDSVAK